MLSRAQHATQHASGSGLRSLLVPVRAVFATANQLNTASTQQPQPVAATTRQPLANETPAALLRRLRWTVLRPLATALGGDERSLLLGPGLELDELREYQPGDDVRHIDWNITARTELPHVRQARVERALDVWLIVDLSASQHWGTARCLKSQRALEFCALAGQLLGRQGNRIGALPFAAVPLGILPPAAGLPALLRTLERLAQLQQPEGSGTTDLAAALRRIEKLARRRALLLIVSDFLAPDGWQKPLARLAQRHDIVAVRLHDPREAELPDVGILTLEDPETGAQLTVNTSDRRLRERFAAAAQVQADAIRADLTRHGVDELLLSTAEDLLPALVRFLKTRRAAGRLRHLARRIV